MVGLYPKEEQPTANGKLGPTINGRSRLIRPFAEPKCILTSKLFFKLLEL